MRRAHPGACLLPFAFILSAGPLAAQTASMRVSIPSPAAAALGQFGDVPVALHSGLPDLAIPIFTAQGATLELPITLRYHGGGIRVEEIGSWVGLGWALEAGGAITRTVRGIRDDDADGYYNRGHVFYSGTNWSNPTPTLLRQIADDELDGEPDQFFFNFAGRSGQFVMGPTDATGAVKEVRTIPYQKLRIVPTIPLDKITRWTVTTEDGTRYTFAAVESSTDHSIAVNGSIPDKYGETHASSWHLTGVRAPGGDSISLHYSSYTAEHRVGRYIERFDLRQSSAPQECVPDQFGINHQQLVSSQRLDSIRSAVHTVRFHSSLRADALSPTGDPQEPRLDSIVVATPSGTILRTFQFSYDMFGGNRLRLLSLAEVNPTGTSLPPYTFQYDSQSFPELSSNAQDHWGYWNGRSNSTLIPETIGPTGGLMSGADRSPNAGTMAVGSLTRITYPTGGYTRLVWEANDYGGISSSDVAPRGYGSEQTRRLESFGTEGTKSTSFTIDGLDEADATVTVNLSPNEDCQDPNTCFTGPRAELNPGLGRWTQSVERRLLLSPGTYTLVAHSAEVDDYAQITVRWRERTTTPRKLAGGLRIAELATGDGMGVEQVRRFLYTRQSDTTRSSGIVNAEPEYAYIYSSPECYYYSRSSMSRMPLGSGPPVTYQEVTVLHGPTGEYGRSRETFRSVADKADHMVYNIWPFSRTTSYQWKRGQRIDAIDYSASGVIRRRQRATYAFLDPDTVTTRSFPGISLNAFAANWAGGSTYLYNPFQVISAWTYQDVDSTYVFDEGGAASVVSTTEYRYANPEHLQPTETVETNPGGRQRVTRMSYPADFASGGTSPEAAALAAMRGPAHMHNWVVERVVIDRNDGTDAIVQAELTTFRQFLAGQYLPYQKFFLNSAGPIQ